MSDWLHSGPVKISPIQWYGGKYRLLKYILPFPDHDIYVEVFGGSGVVLLNKYYDKDKKVFELYNDINDRLVNFWRVLKNYRNELKDYFDKKENIAHRTLFYEYKKPSDNEIEDAYRFFYINRFSFSGMMSDFQGFHSYRRASDMKSYLNHVKKIDEIWERIKYVHFENQDFRKLLKRLDKPKTVWYLDPPYFQGGEHYEKCIGGQGWGQQDFEDLREILFNVKNAQFVLSIDNIDYFKNDNWFYEKIERINSAGCKEGKTASRAYEYIVRNFDPKKPVHEWDDNEPMGDFMLL